MQMLSVAMLIVLPLVSTQPPKSTLVGASTEFSIPNWRYAPRDVVLSKDGTAICALSLGIDSPTYYFAWDVASGKTLAQGEINVGPIPHRGGCLAGDEASARHPPISLSTWDSPSAPIFVWNIGQQIDLQSKTQTTILHHPGWDAWESFSIVPGWSLSNLDVRQLNSVSSQSITHWIEWNTPQSVQPKIEVQPFLKRFVVWSAFKRRSIECLSQDGRWIALASPSDPDFSKKDIKPIVDELGPALQLRMWSVGNSIPVRNFVFKKPVVSIELSHRGNYLIARDKDENCDVIETTNGIPVGTLGKHTSRVYWSENEESLYIVDVGKRTVSHYRVSPFQLEAVFQLPRVNERGFENIIVDPDLERAVGWFYVSPADNIIATTLQLFDFRRVGHAPRK